MIRTVLLISLTYLQNSYNQFNQSLTTKHLLQMYSNYNQSGYGFGNRSNAYRMDFYNQDQPLTVKYDDDEPIVNQQQLAKSTTTGEAPSLADLENSIKLNLRLKKTVVRSSSFAEQTFPMLVSLSVDNLKSTTKAPLDLVCVIDHSGSMQGEKMELVKNTFKYLLEYLGDSDRLSIIIFNSCASRLISLVRTTSDNKQKILSALSTVQACGGTNINLGMQHALQILKQRKHSNPVSSIFLLSDGLDGGAQHKVSTSLATAGFEESVTINTFGFGSDHDPQLMNDIAALRDGSFYFVDKLDTIDEAFVDCLGGALSSVAQNVQISISPEQSDVLNGVQIVKAYGEASMWSCDDLIQTYTTKLATLITGRQKDFVLELKVPANSKLLQDHEKSIRVATAQAEMTTLNNEKIVKKAELVITLLNEDEEMLEEEDDKEVMKNFFRVKGALMISEARVLADQGKNDDAKKLLEGFKEQLENSFMKREEFIMNLVKDIDAAIEAVNPVVYASHGKHDMFQNARAQMYQKSNLASANCYQNERQCEMIKEVRSKKFQ